MKKNKILFFIFALVLIVSVGCTTRQMRLDRTQTRLGMERPNNVPRRDNLGDPNVRPNTINRDTNINPNTRTNVVRRDTNINPNLRTELRDTEPDTVRRDAVTDPNLRTDVGRNVTDTDLVARGSYIAKKVGELNEVDEASVIITGDTALVGVKTKDNIKGEMTTDLKRRVETKVKNTDNRIRNVAVTANPDLATRIRDMVFDIERGRPLSGFAVEIKELLRRITPIK